MPENNEAAKVLPRVRKYLYEGIGLDVGCGSFPVVPNAIGVDARPGAATIVGNISRLPWFADKSMDFVFSSHALEDLQDTKAILEEWCRVIKPGGYLVLYLPHEDFYPRVGHPLANTDHRHNFNTWSILKILQAHPLHMDVVEVSVHGFEGTYEDLHARGGHFKAEYSFQVVARKRGQEPAWAPARLVGPVEPKFHPAWDEGWRVAFVVPDFVTDLPPEQPAIEILAARISEAVNGRVAVSCVRAADVAGDDPVSKNVLQTADFVIDMSTEAHGECWAAAADVPCVIRQDAKVVRWGTGWHDGIGPRTVRCPADGTVFVLEDVVEIARRERAMREDGISLCMIVKNEEQDILHCLSSVKELCDEMVIVDTGSTDATAAIARNFGARVYYWPWADDFAAARNYSLARAKRKWTFWMDADDELRTPVAEVKSILASTTCETLSAHIHYGGARFDHQRFFLTEKKVRFGASGIVHEYPVIDGLRSGHSGVKVYHGTRPAPPTKQRESRNVRLTRKQTVCWPDNPRHWFYYGNALRESGRLAEAVDAYKKYSEIGWWRDELAIAWRHTAHCHVDLGNRAAARQALCTAVSIDGRWAETYFDLGTLCLEDKNLDEALRWFEMAASTPLHESSLFKQESYYGPEPLKAIIRIRLTRGEIDLASETARRLTSLGVVSPEMEHVEAIRLGRPGKNNCVICGGATRAAATAMGPNWASCPRCNVVEQDGTVISISPSSVADNKVDEALQWEAATRWIAGRIEEKAKELLNPQKLTGLSSRMRVLDFMSSAPVVASEMTRRGHYSVALDASARLLTVPYAGECDELKVFKWGDGETYFPDWADRYDLIVALHALEHVPNRQSLKELFHCLRPGGLLFSRHVDLDVTGCAKRAVHGETFHVFSRRGVEALAREFGLEVISWEPREGNGEADVWFRKSQRGVPLIRRPASVGGKPILVSRNGSIGDVLMATYAVKKLKEAMPDVDIDFAAHPSCHDILVGNPHIRRVVPTEVGWQLGSQDKYSEVRYCEYPTLRPRATSCVPHRHMDYPELPLQKHLVDLFAECCGIDTPHGGEPGSLVLRFLPEELVFADTVEKFRARSKMSHVVTIQTGTGWSKYKEWPAEKWSRLVLWLNEGGVGVIQVGSLSDPSLAISEPHPGFFDMRGATTIREACVIVAHADAHVGLDSLFNHVTNACSKKGVILWGSTSPTGSGYPHNVNIVKPPSFGCQPCYRETNSGSVHPKGPCPHAHACMDSIHVMEVHDAVSGLLQLTLG